MSDSDGCPHVSTSSLYESEAVGSCQQIESVSDPFYAQNDSVYRFRMLPSFPLCL